MIQRKTDTDLLWASSGRGMVRYPLLQPHVGVETHVRLVHGGLPERDVDKGLSEGTSLQGLQLRTQDVSLRLRLYFGEGPTSKRGLR